MNVRLWIKDCFEMRVSVPTGKFQQSVGAISCKLFKDNKSKKKSARRVTGSAKSTSICSPTQRNSNKDIQHNI